MPRWPVDRSVEGDGGLSVSSFVPMLPWCDSGGDSGDVDGSGDGGGGDIDGDGGGRVLLLVECCFCCCCGLRLPLWVGSSAKEQQIEDDAYVCLFVGVLE